MKEIIEYGKRLKQAAIDDDTDLMYLTWYELSGLYDFKTLLHRFYSSNQDAAFTFQDSLSELGRDLIDHNAFANIKDINTFPKWIQTSYMRYIQRVGKETRELFDEQNTLARKELNEIAESENPSTRKLAILIAYMEETMASKQSLLIFYRYLLDIDKDGEGIKDGTVAQSIGLSHEAYRKRKNGIVTKYKETFTAVDESIYQNLSSEYQAKADAYYSDLSLLWDSVLVSYRQILATEEWASGLKDLVENGTLREPKERGFLYRDTQDKFKLRYQGVDLEEYYDSAEYAEELLQEEYEDPDFPNNNITNEEADKIADEQEKCKLNLSIKETLMRDLR